MTITYTWKITELSCYPEFEGQSNVIFNANWILFGTDGVTICQINGTQPLTYVAGSPFTPYSSLTQSQVVDWVKSAMGSDAVLANEKIVNDLVVETIVPETYQPPLPWSN